MICQFVPYQRAHPAIHADVQVHNSNLPASKISQPSIVKFVNARTNYSSHDTRQERITDALVIFIAGDLLPLSLVDSPHFHTLMERADPCYTVPSLFSY